MSASLELGVCSINEAGVEELGKQIEDVLAPIIGKFETLFDTLEKQVTELEQSLSVLEKAAAHVEKPALNKQKRVLQQLNDDDAKKAQEKKEAQREEERKVKIVYTLFQSQPSRSAPGGVDISDRWTHAKFKTQFLAALATTVGGDKKDTKRVITFYPTGYPRLAGLLGGPDWGRTVQYHVDTKKVDDLVADWNNLRAAFDTSPFEFCIVPMFLAPSVKADLKTLANENLSKVPQVSPFVLPFQKPGGKALATLIATVTQHFDTTEDDTLMWKTLGNHAESDSFTWLPQP